MPVAPITRFVAAGAEESRPTVMVAPPVATVTFWPLTVLPHETELNEAKLDPEQPVMADAGEVVVAFERISAYTSTFIVWPEATAKAAPEKVYVVPSVIEPCVVPNCAPFTKTFKF